MNRWLKVHFEKVLLLFAAASLLGSAGWLRQSEAEIRRIRTLETEGESLPATPQTQSREQARPHSAGSVASVWADPAVQSQGGGWRYEVFTPPAVYYNASAKVFAVTAPGERMVREASWGIELVGVKLAPYRLQLTGYFGAPGDYVATFSSPDSPEVLLARVGHRFDKLGLRLVDFQIKKVPVPHEGNWPVHDVAAIAVLRDEATGSDVILDNRVRKNTDTPLAVCKLIAGDTRLRELREGDTLSVDTTDYHVERIQLSPPQLVVTRRVAGTAQSEMKTLSLLADKSAQSISAPFPPMAELTLNTK